MSGVQIHENAPPVVLETPAAVTVVEVEKETTVQEAVQDAAALVALAKEAGADTETKIRLDHIERKLDLLLDKVERMHGDILDVGDTVETAAIIDMVEDEKIADKVEEVSETLEEVKIPATTTAEAPPAEEPAPKKPARKRGFF